MECRELCSHRTSSRSGIEAVTDVREEGVFPGLSLSPSRRLEDCHAELLVLS